MEGLIFGLLRYTLYTDLAEMHRGMRYGEGDNCIKWNEAYFNFNLNFYTDEYRNWSKQMIQSDPFVSKN